MSPAVANYGILNPAPRTPKKCVTYQNATALLEHVRDLQFSQCSRAK